MEIKTLKVRVSKDAMTKPSMEIWPWELPVLEERFPDGLVELYGEGQVSRDSLPDAESEFTRLARKYGGEDAQPLVSYAYGRGRAGVGELAKAIRKAEIKASKAPAAKKAKVSADPPENDNPFV